MLRIYVAGLHQPQNRRHPPVSCSVAVAATTLRLRSKHAGLALQLDHVVHEFDRNPEVRGGCPMRVPLFNKIHNTRP